MIRFVKTRFPFNGLPKGHVFTYDTLAEDRIPALVEAGILEDVTEKVSSSPPAVIFEMPSIESELEVGEIGGQGTDQPCDGGNSSEQALHPGGKGGLQGDQGTVPKVAKKR